MNSFFPGMVPQDTADSISITISAKNARLEFQGCSPDYIKTVCKGRCCWIATKTKEVYTTVYVEEDQQAAIKSHDGTFNEHGILVTDEDGKCHFQDRVSGFCKLRLEQVNGESIKPHSCSISPWVLSKKGRLFIRNRYKLLRCYKMEPRVPAYRAFRSGLVVLFGEEEVARIVAHFDGGGGDYPVQLSRIRAKLVRGVMLLWKSTAARRSNHEPQTAE